MAALVAAMLGQAGFVDWPGVIGIAAMVAGVALAALAGIVAATVGVAILLSPMGLLLWGLVRLLEQFDRAVTGVPAHSRAGVKPGAVLR